ncbi:MAG: hypothetical protein KDJ52_08535 [Anaerolineae bacterium]|nr:hypothetical protein [Anaerolineae bacterium]
MSSIEQPGISNALWKVYKLLLELADRGEQQLNNEEPDRAENTGGNHRSTEKTATRPDERGKLV